MKKFVQEKRKAVREEEKNKKKKMEDLECKIEMTSECCTIIGNFAF